MKIDMNKDFEMEFQSTVIKEYGAGSRNRDCRIFECGRRQRAGVESDRTSDQCVCIF